MTRSIGRMLRVSTLAAVALAGLAVAAPGRAQAACYNPQQALPAQTIADFVANANRGQFLSGFPAGGASLIAQIRDLVASDPTTLPLILQLLANANGEQLNAIGIGLGQGALVCTRVDQAFATEIQQAVAATNNDGVMVAFASVLGDRPIAALGGGGGGASGGAGGGQINPITGSGTGGSSTTPTFTSFFTRNTGTNLFTSSSSSPGSPGGTSTTTNTTTVTSVSPSK
jgi:hypothetical protein